MMRFINLLMVLCYMISIGSLVVFNLYYFFVILPELRRIGKSSFPKAFFIWGQDIADMMEYEEIAKTSEMKNRLRTYKKIGLVFLISLPILLIVFTLKIIITKSI